MRLSRVRRQVGGDAAVSAFSTTGRTVRMRYSWHRRHAATMREWIVPLSGPYRRLGFLIRWRGLVVMVMWGRDRSS